MKTISSQRYIDQNTVSEKREANDYTVLVSPIFTHDGDVYRVVIDGHHSLAAANESGSEANYVEANEQDCDYIGLINSGDIEGFLSAAHLGDDYYDVNTGHFVW